jgi:hypothetical protein
MTTALTFHPSSAANDARALANGSTTLRALVDSETTTAKTAAASPVVSIDETNFKNPSPLARRLKARYEQQLGAATAYVKQVTGRDVPFKLIFDNQNPGEPRELASTNWRKNPPEITIHLYDDGSGQLQKNYAGNTSDESLLVALTHEIFHAAARKFIISVRDSEGLNSPSLALGMPPYPTAAPTNRGLGPSRPSNFADTLVEGTADLYANRSVPNGAQRFPSGTYWNFDRFAEQLEKRLPAGVLNRVMFNTDNYPAYATERKLVIDTLNTIRIEGYSKAADQVLAGSSSLKATFKENHLLLLAFFNPEHPLVEKFEAAYAARYGVKLNLSDFVQQATTSELSRTPDEVDAINQRNPIRPGRDPKQQADAVFFTTTFPSTLRKIYGLWPSVVNAIPNAKP